MPTRRRGGRRATARPRASIAIPSRSPQRSSSASRRCTACRPSSLLVGRGSDEAIDVLSRIYLRAGADAILQCPPTFGMYRVAAHIQGAGVVESRWIARAAGRSIRIGCSAPGVRSMKLVYLCSPNNPTGNSFDARRDRGGVHRARRQGHRGDRRGLHRVVGPREPHRMARAFLDPRRSAHLVEGARARGRAHRRADRAPGAHRTGEAHHPALLARPADHRGGARARSIRAKSPPARVRVAGAARGAGIPARAACSASAW